MDYGYEYEDQEELDSDEEVMQWIQEGGLTYEIGLCFVCHKTVWSTDGADEVFPFHWDCVKCHTCGKKFQDKKEYSFIWNLFYCKEHNPYMGFRVPTMERYRVYKPLRFD